MMAYTTLAERQKNVPFGLGRGAMPACLINGQVLYLAALQGKVPAVSPLLVRFGRVLTSKSRPQVRRPAVRDKRPFKNFPQPGVRLKDWEGSVNQVETVADSTCKQGAP